MTDETKARIASMLLKELKAGVRATYYISIANEKFLGGVYLDAFGPTDAWMLMHRLNLFPVNSNANTQTTGPIAIDRVPNDKKWRLLTRAEIDP